MSFFDKKTKEEREEAKKRYLQISIGKTPSGKEVIYVDDEIAKMSAFAKQRIRETVEKLAIAALPPKKEIGPFSNEPKPKFNKTPLEKFIAGHEATKCFLMATSPQEIKSARFMSNEEKSRFLKMREEAYLEKFEFTQGRVRKNIASSLKRPASIPMVNNSWVNVRKVTISYYRMHCLREDLQARKELLKEVNPEDIKNSKKLRQPEKERFLEELKQVQKEKTAKKDLRVDQFKKELREMETDRGQERTKDIEPGF